MRKSLFVCAVPLGLVMSGLLSAPAPAQVTSYTATGWINQVLSPPIIFPAPPCQMLVRAHIFVLRVESADPRLKSRCTVYGDGYFQADGSAVIYGNVHQQVGTWAGTNFTPGAGVWEVQFRGVMQTNSSFQISRAGYGVGGTIDGLRLEDTATREPADINDPTVPFLYTGTIKPAPVDTTEVVDDFHHPYTVPTYGNGTCFISNNLFYAVGDHFQPTHSIYDSYVFGGTNRSWTVPDGMTLEWRGGLVHLDDNGTNTAILAVGGSAGPGYAFHKGRDFAFLLKWSSTFSYCALFCERTALPNTNVVLALALTRMGSNLAFTTRVLDKATPSRVLYQRTVVDTPGADSTVGRDQFKTLTGIDFADMVGDMPEAPPTLFGVSLGVFQNTDGHQPVPTAVFDNLELLTYEVPHISIASAVQLTWPAPAGAYSLESAPSANGPWALVQTLAIPGVNEMTLPASGPMRFFRPVQAP